MALNLVPRLTSSTPDLTQATDLIKKVIDPLLQQKYPTGRLIQGVSVTAAVPFVVAHGLGRAAIGAHVVAATGSAQVVVRQYGSYVPTPDPLQQIALIPSATGVISLWIF